MTEKNWSSEVELTISFHDCDPLGIVWHGNYLRYFEIAREKLLANINYSYRKMMDSGFVWPIVNVKLKYRKYLTFEQVIIVTAAIKEYENRLKIDYAIFDKKTGEKLTTGYTIQVAVDKATNELLFESPAILFECLGIQK